MKLSELQQKVDRRTALKEALDMAEDEFKALEADIKEYGNDVVLSAIRFNCPVEVLGFEMEGLPSIPAAPFVKAIGGAIDIVRNEIKQIEDELKGIVEFED